MPILKHKRKTFDKSKTLCDILIEWEKLPVILTEKDSEVSCRACKKKLPKEGG